MSDQNGTDELDAVYDYIQLIVCGLTLFVGAGGNILVLFIESRLKKKATVHDVFIVNLAAADLALVVIYMPMYITMYLNALSASPILCHLVIPVVTTTFITSIFTITSMAIQRCRVIINPWKRKMSQRRAKAWAAVTWILALVITLPYMVVNEPKDGLCVENWPTADLKRAYTGSLVTLQYALPLLIIAGCYVRMAVFIRNSRAQQTLKLYGIDQRSVSARKRKENWMIFKTVAVIVVAFAVSMLPAQVVWLLTDFADVVQYSWFARVNFAANILATLHSCLNPVIYGTVNTHFRREYAKCLARLCACADVAETGKSSGRHGQRQHGRGTLKARSGRGHIIESAATKEERTVGKVFL